MGARDPGAVDKYDDLQGREPTATVEESHRSSKMTNIITIAVHKMDLSRVASLREADAGAHHQAGICLLNR
ncbi:hypothetical protein Apa02nite_020420 [Actinoplanes palleronii]|uniref:Uncharacterized protein n=1 Tax=Actinoplanes palleronii TaxID=113570 RepID=A0ABQ4B5J0_9ACTN|nr:hypothetical protein Apa02nite_020420 [Actinoplanes palleronii]